MKVFKFGGGCLKSADDFRIMGKIVRPEKSLFIVVSAMGKTTNALESVLNMVMKGNIRDAQFAIETIRHNHLQVARELLDGVVPDSLERHFARLTDTVASAENIPEAGYDLWYDKIVGYGELVSSALVTEYLLHIGILAEWADMRRSLITGYNHREANVDFSLSAPSMRRVMANSPAGIVVGQGFIGSTPSGEPTTLGREGSDYSAAAIGNLLDAESVTVWKDVDGVLNADPKIFKETVLIPELTYLDAIELAYGGAQIIHPKTIKPLQNKNIPLYVRPFYDAGKPGTVIHNEVKEPISVPVLILKPGQVLVSIRPKDFSFVLEEKLAYIFSLMERSNIKINMIQSSAVNLSLCVDNLRNLESVVAKLREDFRVVFNDGLELLTIRGYTPELYRNYSDDEGVLVLQRTRRTMRAVRRSEKQ